MAKYRITFIQMYSYEVEAEGDSQAENIAYKEFANDMRSPIARTSYDDIEIEELEEEDDEEY